MSMNIRKYLKHLTPVQRLIASPGYQHLRYRIQLYTERRSMCQVVTHFFRLRRQYDALAGPVAHFFRERQLGRPLRIIDIGCSTGQEVYSIIITMTSRCPDLPFHVYAYDISPEALARAEAGHFTTREVEENPRLSALLQDHFDRNENGYAIDPALKRHATFAHADIRDPATLAAIGHGDIVFAQNLLFNFQRADARRMFEQIVRLLASPSFLFIAGMDVDLRARLTRKHGLEPLCFEIEEIHEDARRTRLAGWPYHYWGLEPLSKQWRDWERRYATIFVKP